MGAKEIGFTLKGRATVVVHACNLSYLGGRDRIMLQGQPGQNKQINKTKTTSPYLKNKVGVVVRACNPSMQGYR
jgi:hypothetical protein